MFFTVVDIDQIKKRIESLRAAIAENNRLKEEVQETEARLEEVKRQHEEGTQ